jgi:hypothetical protein
MDRGKCLGNLGVVDEPADFRVNRAADRYLADEGMSVKPFAFVTRGHSRQPVRGLEREFLYKFDYHSIQILSLLQKTLQTHIYCFAASRASAH